MRGWSTGGRSPCRHGGCAGRFCCFGWRCFWSGLCAAARLSLLPRTPSAPSSAATSARAADLIARLVRRRWRTCFACCICICRGILIFHVWGHFVLRRFSSPIVRRLRFRRLRTWIRVEIRRLQRSRASRGFFLRLFTSFELIAHPFTHVRLVTYRAACGQFALSGDWSFGALVQQSISRRCALATMNQL